MLLLAIREKVSQTWPTSQTQRIRGKDRILKAICVTISRRTNIQHKLKAKKSQITRINSVTRINLVLTTILTCHPPKCLRPWLRLWEVAMLRMCQRSNWLALALPKTGRDKKPTINSINNSCLSNCIRRQPPLWEPNKCLCTPAQVTTDQMITLCNKTMIPT